MENLVRRLLIAAAAFLIAGCSASTSHPAASVAPLPPDPHTAAALLTIATTFNHDYDYTKRHNDCPTGSPVLSHTESASPGGPHGAWLVHYEIGGQQLTDYWFYEHRRWVFDLVLSNPDAVKLYRMSPQQYVAALGCAH
jgi:hypothetical protein